MSWGLSPCHWARRCLFMAPVSYLAGAERLSHIHPSLLNLMRIRLFHAMGICYLIIWSKNIFLVLFYINYSDVWGSSRPWLYFCTQWGCWMHNVNLSNGFFLVGSFYIAPAIGWNSDYNRRSIVQCLWFWHYCVDWSPNLKYCFNCWVEMCLT